MMEKQLVCVNCTDQLEDCQCRHSTVVEQRLDLEAEVQRREDQVKENG